MRTRFFAFLLSWLPLGCAGGAPAGEIAAAAGASGSTKAGTPNKGPQSRKGGSIESETPAANALLRIEFREDDYAESERSRDPFRSFTEVFNSQPGGGNSPQLHVAAKKYSLDELKLVGIVTRSHPPRAMFVDPSGKGHVVDHGDFLGKPEVVQGGTTTGSEIHWRVDRVRANDVVLIRENPANPDVPSATRVFTLRTALIENEE
jgi:type IV pilus assembly protein PilP